MTMTMMTITAGKSDLHLLQRSTGASPNTGGALVLDALRGGRLPGEHRDPFDRMIAAQALAGDLPVLSNDPKLDVFSIRRIW
jgi:hypothetical protein